jgi:hypothetical protein
MPTIFQARCEHCSYISEAFLSEYSAVFAEGSQTDATNSVVAGAVLFGPEVDTEIADQRDPRLIVLPHPVETTILAQLGYTWISLLWAGRYVRIRRVICRSCGRLFDVRRLTCPPAVGCQIGCLAGLVFGIGIGLWQRSFYLGFLTTYGITLGCSAVASVAGWLYVRLRFRERARELDGPPRCPGCGDSGYVGIVERRRTFPCPQCSAHALHIFSIGIS